MKNYLPYIIYILFVIILLMVQYYCASKMDKLDEQDNWKQIDNLDKIGTQAWIAMVLSILSLVIFIPLYKLKLVTHVRIYIIANIILIIIGSAVISHYPALAALFECGITQEGKWFIGIFEL